MVRRKKRLGQFLISRRWLDRAGLERALATQSVVGAHLGTCLLDLDLITEERLERALSEHLGFPAASADDLRNVPPAVQQLIPRRMAVRHRAVPFRSYAVQLDVALIDIGNLVSLDELAFASGRRINPYVASEPRILEALDRYYEEECPQWIAKLIDRLNRTRYMWADEDSAAAASAGDWSDPAVELFPETPQLLPPPLPEAGPAPLPPSPRAADFAPPPATHFEPAPLSAIEPLPLTGDEALAMIDAAGDRDEVGGIVVSFLLQSFNRVGLFGVRHDRVVGWLGGGDDFEERALAAFTLPLEQPSIFLNLASGSTFHLGPLAAMPAHRLLAACWGGRRAEECLLMPVRFGERLAAVIYADRAPGPLGAVDLEQLLRLANRAAIALERCIVLKKQRQSSSWHH